MFALELSARHVFRKTQAIVCRAGSADPDRMLKIFQVETFRGVATVLRVEGDLDFHYREPFHKALQLAADNGAERLVISLEGCRLMDCSGIGVLVATRKALGSRLKIVISQEAFIRRIFGVLELTEPLASMRNFAL